MAIVHLVYPANRYEVRAPYSIGNALISAFWAAGHRVTLYDWDLCHLCHTPEPVGPDDVLLGHPHPAIETTFRNGLKQPFARKVALAPLTPSPHCEWALEIMPCVDHFLAISGETWWRSMGSWQQWRHRMTRLDMAVDVQHYPRIKTKFSPCGERKYLYIGCALPEKGAELLSAIGESLPITHIGTGCFGPHIRSLGCADFENPIIREFLAGFDFLIVPGLWDANPTVILEAMCWGILPVPTVRSGYDHVAGLSLPDTADAAVSYLKRLQWMPDDVLQAKADYNRSTVEANYGWGKFTAKVLEACQPTG